MAPKARSNTPKTTELNKKFWQNFAKNIWEKKELVARNVNSELLQMGDAEIFDLLVLYSDRCRQINDPEGFKFFIEGFKVDPEEVLQVLPEKSDKTLLGYHQRMSKLFPDYCLVCDELLKVNLKKQHLLTDFTDQLYQHVGFPNRFSEMGLYLGNYRKTPFGVHVDSCGVFSFPVAGVKRFRLWSPEFVKKNPALDRAFTYEKYKKSSTLLEARPGDMTYWPSSAWHIAESDGSFSATWSLGVWVDHTHQDMFAEALQTLLIAKNKKSGLAPTTHFKELHAPNGNVSVLPNAYVQSIETLKNISVKELEDTFLTAWMTHISSQGLKSQASSEVKISSRSIIRLRYEKAPVLWRHSLTRPQDLEFSFGGVLVKAPEAKGLLKLIKDLNAGEICKVSDYISAKDKPWLKVLQSLANAGAFKSEFQD